MQHKANSTESEVGGRGRARVGGSNLWGSARIDRLAVKFVGSR